MLIVGSIWEFAEKSKPDQSPPALRMALRSELSSASSCKGGYYIKYTVWDQESSTIAH